VIPDCFPFFPDIRLPDVRNQLLAPSVRFPAARNFFNNPTVRLPAARNYFNNLSVRLPAAQIFFNNPSVRLPAVRNFFNNSTVRHVGSYSVWENCYFHYGFDIFRITGAKKTIIERTTKYFQLKPKEKVFMPEPYGRMSLSSNPVSPSVCIYMQSGVAERKKVLFLHKRVHKWKSYGN
jgi:hypothetical protein